MKITVNHNWLCSIVPDLIQKSPEEIGNAFTELGIETEEIQILNYDQDIKLAKVVQIEQTKILFSVSLETNSGFHCVVTDSLLLSVGDFVLFAPIEARIFSKKIENTDIEGFILTLEHLDIEQKSTDIIHLGNDFDNAQKMANILLETDFLYTLDVAGNRPDLLSVLGLAKSLAIYFHFSIFKDGYSYKTSTECPISVDIKTDKCSRYQLCHISNLDIYKPSKPTIKKRLLLLGMRPINTIVDLSNIIMLETGQPIHTFDAKKVKGSLSVRQAQNNEEILLLNQLKITLTSEDTVISDSEKIIALAGIMGCANSCVDDTTTEIYIESAHFDSTAIRRSSRRLGIKTESSLRFEKSISSSIVALAQNYFCSSIKILQPQIKISTIYEIYPNPIIPNSIMIKTSDIQEYLGTEKISEIFIIETIQQMGCTITKIKDKWEIIPSPERTDLSIKEDIIEEIARFYGYNNIPSRIYRPTKIILSPDKTFEEKIRPILRGMGLCEAVTMVFRSAHQQEHYMLPHSSSIAITNPLNMDWTHLRTHLFDGLCESVKFNSSKAFIKNIALSEIGTIFHKHDGVFVEQKKLSFILSHEKSPYQKGLNILHNILHYAKCNNVTATQNQNKYSFLHPLNSFEIKYQKTTLGFFGELHPSLAEKINLSDKNTFPTPVVCELDFDILKQCAEKKISFQEISERPPIFRDITLSVSQDVMGMSLLTRIKRENCLIRDIEFLSTFQNDFLASAQKYNISLRLRFESSEIIESKKIDQFINQLLDHYK